MRNVYRGAIGALVALGTALPAQAVTVPGGDYYTDVVGGGIGDVAVTTGGGAGANVGDPSGRNDDGFRGPIDLGFSLDFFGTSYSQFFANNNGNISFGQGVSTFTPDPLDTTSEAPIIAPYWADVDTRGADSGVMHVRQFENKDQVAVTWNEVGHFSRDDGRLASFQLVVRGPDFDVPDDEGRIGFFYKDVEWETGDVTGDDGFGGTEATAGFGDGEAVVNDGEVSLPGSQQPGISDFVENDNFWFDLGNTGTPEPVPAPATGGLLLMGMAALGFRRRRAK